MRLFWLTASLIFLLDRITKYFILKSNFSEIKVLPFLSIVKLWNKGIAFGLFSNIEKWGTFILSILTILILGITYFWARKILSQERKNPVFLFALGSIFGGGLGNLIDRILFGKVLDFIDFYIGPFHWPAFNIADLAITISLFLIFLKSFKS